MHIPHFQYLSGRLKVFFAGLENRKFIEKQLNHHMNSNNQVPPLTCICKFEAPLIFIYLLYCYSISSFLFIVYLCLFLSIYWLFDFGLPAAQVVKGSSLWSSYLLIRLPAGWCLTKIYFQIFLFSFSYIVIQMGGVCAMPHTEKNCKVRLHADRVLHEGGCSTIYFYV